MTNCPICYSTLEPRECAPCHDCGGEAIEIEHLQQRTHSYSIYEYQDVRLTLCDSCYVDFPSYRPNFWGLKENERIDIRDLIFIKSIEDPQTEIDKYCLECGKRLRFLKILDELRGNQL